MERWKVEVILKEELLGELIMQMSSWWGVLSLLKQQLCFLGM